MAQVDRVADTPLQAQPGNRCMDLRMSFFQKIDELEDVFEFSRRACDAAGRERPSSVFMELQMKNTFLQAGGATVRGVKVFAVLAGDARLGMPMRRVYGV